MYRIYALSNDDDSGSKRLIYSPLSGSDGPQITNAMLDMQINTAGTLSITIPLGNRNRSYIDAFRNTIIIEQDGKEIWRGRPISSTHDINSSRTITCEGELAFLNDVLVPNYDYSWNGEGTEGVNDGSENSDRRVTIEQFMTTLLKGYGNVASDNRKIELGHIDDNLADRKINAKSEEYDSVYNQLLTHTIDEFGGVLYLNHYDEKGKFSNTPKLEYYEESAGENAQKVELTVNLLDYNANSAYEDFATVIYPFGEKTVEYEVPVQNDESVDEEEDSEIEAYADEGEEEETAGSSLLATLKEQLAGIVEQMGLVDPDSEDYASLLEQKLGLESQIADLEASIVTPELPDITTTVTSTKVSEKVVVTIASVNQQEPGRNYITAGEEVLNKYGIIQKAVYCDYSTPIEVYNFGVRELAKAVKRATTHEVSALDMHLIDPSQNRLEIGKMVQVTFKTTTSSYRIESASLDILNPANSTYSLSDANIIPSSSLRIASKIMFYYDSSFGETVNSFFSSRPGSNTSDIEKMLNSKYYIIYSPFIYLKNQINTFYVMGLKEDSNTYKAYTLELSNIPIHTNNYRYILFNSNNGDTLEEWIMYNDFAKLTPRGLLITGYRPPNVKDYYPTPLYIPMDDSYYPEWTKRIDISNPTSGISRLANIVGVVYIVIDISKDFTGTINVQHNCCRIECTGETVYISSTFSNRGYEEGNYRISTLQGRLFLALAHARHVPLYTLNPVILDENEDPYWLQTRVSYENGMYKIYGDWTNIHGYKPLGLDKYHFYSGNSQIDVQISPSTMEIGTNFRYSKKNPILEEEDMSKCVLIRYFSVEAMDWIKYSEPNALYPEGLFLYKDYPESQILANLNKLAEKFGRDM